VVWESALSSTSTSPTATSPAPNKLILARSPCARWWPCPLSARGPAVFAPLATLCLSESLRVNRATGSSPHFTGDSSDYLGGNRDALTGGDGLFHGLPDRNTVTGAERHVSTSPLEEVGLSILDDETHIPVPTLDEPHRKPTRRQVGPHVCERDGP